MADPQLTPAEEALANELQANLQGRVGAISTRYIPYSPEFKAKIEEARKAYDKGNDPATAKLLAEGVRRGLEKYGAIPGNEGFAQKRINAMNLQQKGALTQPAAQGSGRKTTTTATEKTTTDAEGKVVKEKKVTVTSDPSQKPQATSNKNPPLSLVPPTPPPQPTPPAGAAIPVGGQPAVLPPPPPHTITPTGKPSVPDSRYTSTKGLPHDSNTAEKNVDTTIKGMSPIPGEFHTAQSDVIKQRIRQIEDLQQMEQGFVDQYEPQTNLSPLLSWIGSQLGRDYLKGYTPPMTLEDVMTFQEKLAANTNKARGGLADSQMDYLKARMLMQDKQSSGESIKDTYATQTSKNNGTATERLNLAQNAAEDANNKVYKQMEGDTIKAFSTMQDDVAEAYRAAADLNEYIAKYTGSRRIQDDQVKDPRLSEILARLRSSISRLSIKDNVHISKLGALAKDDIKIIEGVVGASARGGMLEHIFAGGSKFLTEKLLKSLDMYASEITKVARQKRRDSQTYTTDATRAIADKDWEEYIAKEKNSYRRRGKYSPSEIEEAKKILEERK